MKQARRGALDTLECGDPEAALIVVLLHGRGMQAADLAPFARSLGVAAHFIVPQAPLVLDDGGRSWWPPRAERDAQRAQGAPSDLYRFDPPGRDAARALLIDALEDIDAARRLVLVGFSQGGMLAMDAVLAGLQVRGLALLSASCIALDAWRPALPRLAGTSILVAHGRHDMELAFSAGERLRDEARAAGARVDWRPFDGGHGIPLLVWRALRRFLCELSRTT